MLSIGLVGSGGAGADYYLSRAEGRVAAYYTDAEHRGRWVGSGAATLGLTGRLDAAGEAAFRNLLAGLGTSDELDLTFSAPKSVRLLLAFGGEEVGEAVTAAHTAAVEQALAYLEQAAGHGLRGHQGDGERANRIATNGFVAAAFEHRCSRSLDPQLHTHVVVANLLHGSDGRWSALDSRALHRHARTAGYLYQAVLRGELTASLGVRWNGVRRGQAEIAGIPSRMLHWFSSRRMQIARELVVHGHPNGSAAAARAACLATRPSKPKEAADEAGLRQRWRQRAAEGRIDPEQLVDTALTRTQAGPVLDSTATGSLAAELLGPTGLTVHQTFFGREDLLRGLCEHLPSGARIDLAGLRQLAETVLQRPEVVPVDGDGRDSRWTTAELLAAEAQAISLAERLRASDRPGAPAAACEAAIDRAGSLASRRTWSGR